MIHSNKIRDADVHFVIDPITRAIKSASATKTSVIQYDHNSERFTFMLPRYIEGHDMMESTNVEVHYINASAAASGVYIVEDLQTDETEENVVCSWLLSQNVTQNAGVIHFLLRFACVAEDGTVEYVWNTAIYKGISVASGMYNSGEIIEQYADILELWKRELEASQIDVKNTLAALVDASAFKVVCEGELDETTGGVLAIKAEITEDISAMREFHFYVEFPATEENAGTTAYLNANISGAPSGSNSFFSVTSPAALKAGTTYSCMAISEVLNKCDGQYILSFQRSCVDSANNGTNARGNALVTTARWNLPKNTTLYLNINNNVQFLSGTKWRLEGR